MRTFMTAALIMLCAPGTVLAQEGMGDFPKEIARVLQLDEEIGRIARGEVDPGKLSTIYLILQNTNEVYIHRQRGATENQVYRHPDGREAVYDANGDLVQDGINDGSYNYHDPENEPLRHFTYDICPWIMMGNTRKDPTSTGERINAYMNDVAAGIAAAVAQRDELPTWDSSRWTEDGQREALAVYLLAIERGGADDLFGLFETDEPLTQETLVAVVTKLANGFVAVYLPR